jgi:CheY-like chemotaxis protein
MGMAATPSRPAYATLNPAGAQRKPMQPTILIVDDDPQVRTLCRRTLEGAGYLAREAGNGKEALAAIGESAFDLILLDLCMPGKDGFEFLESVRAELPKLKIVVISGFMSATMLPAAKLFGATATLAKPFSPDSLLSAVRQALPGKGPVQASG